ncbi:RraA family protein [Streptomyces profundus]|uniref:RraA family protein n=1 Tax=Streptomyces profundus TaxID=2867410 RepID=UPI001D16E88B|nr:hypothetical protein [Streptomyces sp. MA3_2.13]UED83249.1 hypothetical protein K4G22_02750 [Streptomyces sp. MA3_2.13]
MDQPTVIDEPTRAELLGLGTATLYEASGLDCELAAALRPAWAGARLCGVALPVRTGPGDNLALHRAVAAARPGEVLVVDALGRPHGHWGEVLAVAAATRGVRGLVIDGGVRDTARLAALDFPTFASSIAVTRTAKADPGVVGEPVVVAGRLVARGDVVVADADGVLVLPADALTPVLVRARARTAKEDAFLERIRAGESTLDLYGLGR